MTRISKYALAALLVAISQHASAFTITTAPTTPTTTTTTFLGRHHHHRNTMNTALFMSIQDSTSELIRLPNSAVEVKLSIPGDATKAAYEKACNELSKQVAIPGFRKGARVPPAVLEQSMAAKGGRTALRAEAINSLVSQLMEPVLKDEHGLEPIGKPTLAVPAEELAETFKPGETLQVTVKCDVWPDIQWNNNPNSESDDKPYLGLTGTYKRKPFDQVKLNKAIDDLKERYVELTPAPDGTKLAMGDSCQVNMVGYMATEDQDGNVVKGEALPNAASGDDVEVILGEGRYMTGLVEGLVGAAVGEDRQITVTFPPNLRDKTLAGKKAIFDISVLSASTRTLPEITDEFANKVKAGLTAESLVDELRKALDAENAKEYTPARNNALGKSLAEVMNVDVPDTLVTNQAREKFAMMMTDMRNNGVDDEEIKRQINPENFQKYKEIVQDDIIRDFKVSMACDEIARLEGIDVPDYQVEEQLANIRKDAGDDEEFDETMVRSKVEMTLQRQMVFDFLADNGNLEVEYSDDGNDEFDEELMEKLAQEAIEREAKLAQEAAAAADAE